MSPRPHHYDPDARGGVRRSRADAVRDRSALGPDPVPRRGRWLLWLVALAAGLIALLGWAGGVVLTWWAS